MTVGVAAIFLAGGILVGFLTGMLGLGGGVLMVPIIFETYLHLGTPAKAAFITAVASSLAVIIFTASYASWLHYRDDRLDLRLVTWMGMGTILGVLAGSHVLLSVDNRFVRLSFGIFLWVMALTMFVPTANPKPHGQDLSPMEKLGLLFLGLCMGALAALFGIGGSGLAVPALMIFFGVTVHRAIAAGSSMIVVTALVSSINYMVTGWHDPAAPAHGIGWIDPVAAGFLLPGAMITTRLGVRLAQKVSKQRLRMMLMIFQIFVGARFIFF